MTEITWSLMHPTRLSPEYMQRMVNVANASPVKVDSFEICALCHALSGGLDGVCYYEDFPQLKRDRKAISENIRLLRQVLKIAHDSGRPVYYWHREVTVPDGLVELLPGLLDEKGEFNLLGEAFEKLLRSKLKQAFDNVPELDGIVLTLTEADYSAIHNSTPELYPPAQVVAKVAGIFYDELTRRNKRFILRSFGSISKDYEDILAGAEVLEKQGCRFEIETKITPYDFDPFLPENPFLKHTGTLSLGAECDSLGEFLAAGYLPAENVENIVRWVRSAQRAGVDRFVIRCDRVSNAVIDVYPVNLHAYMRAISEPEVTARKIAEDYAEEHYPENIRQDMLQLGGLGLECVLKTMYLRGNLMFHQFPLKVSLKYLKAGGFFALFKENVPLKYLKDIWSILHQDTTPMRSELLAEKKQAVALALEGAECVEKLREKLPPEDYQRLHRLWRNAMVASESQLALTQCVTAYFDDMEAREKNHPRLSVAAEMANEVCTRLCPQISEAEQEAFASSFVNGLEHDSFVVRSEIAEIFPGPIRGIVRLIVDEYEAEFNARANYADMIDLLIPGSITDEWRCKRAMHASHAMLEQGRLKRIVGNQVFPNGTLGFELNASRPVSSLFLAGKGMCRLSVNGTVQTIALTEQTSVHVTGTHFKVLLAGVKGSFPEIYAAGLK